MILFALVFGRWLHFAGVMVLFGSSLLLNDSPVARRWIMDDDSMRSHLSMLARVAAIFALTGVGIWLLGSIVTIAGDASALVQADVLWSYFLETQFGRVWLVRLVLLAGLGLCIFVKEDGGTTLQRLSIMILAGLLLATQAWLGHAAMGMGSWGALEIATYITHVLAAGAWFGGLPVLALLLWRMGSRSGEAARSAVWGVLDRFSAIGILAVALILLSGIANTIYRGGSIASLISSMYGLLILTKVALLTVAMIAAAQNRFRLMPMLLADRTSVQAVSARLKRNVHFELAVGGSILLAASLLGLLPPFH